MRMAVRSKECVELNLDIHCGGSVWPSGGAQDELELSESDRRIVEMIGEGHSNREIAEQLGIAEKTVKNRVTVILQTLGMQRRTQVAAMVAARRRHGWT